MSESKINLNELSVEQLKQLSTQATHLIQTKEDTRVREAFDKIKEIAKSVNMTVDEMAVWGNNQSRKRKAVEVKYRDPANAENTWTGRGIQPRWLKAALAAGKTLEDFAVESAGTDAA